MRSDPPAYGATTGATRDGSKPADPSITGGGEFLPSGGILEALPMPLGSLSTLGLAGPKGTPLIGELPAPADPAGGVSCAYALGDATMLPSSAMRTNARLRDIESFPGYTSTDIWGARRRS
jgi:hypothetical protein